MKSGRRPCIAQESEHLFGRRQDMFSRSTTLVKSTHRRWPPEAFGMITTPTHNGVGLSTRRMTPGCSSFSSSFFTTSCSGIGIWRGTLRENGVGPGSNWRYTFVRECAQAGKEFSVTRRSCRTRCSSRVEELNHPQALGSRESQQRSAQGHDNVHPLCGQLAVSPQCCRKRAHPRQRFVARSMDGVVDSVEERR